mmetsp:Transcript_31425/g.59818  ORF Transcript_31425/g.59818 Transcript_31425/m.59818 type:complete len:354 (-) Transcript_31425:143-1204(-)
MVTAHSPVTTVGSGGGRGIHLCFSSFSSIAFFLDAISCSHLWQWHDARGTPLGPLLTPEIPDAVHLVQALQTRFLLAVFGVVRTSPDLELGPVDGRPGWMGGGGCRFGPGVEGQCGLGGELDAFGREGDVLPGTVGAVVVVAVRGIFLFVLSVVFRILFIAILIVIVVVVVVVAGCFLVVAVVLPFLRALFETESRLLLLVAPPSFSCYLYAIILHGICFDGRSLTNNVCCSILFDRLTAIPILLFLPCCYVGRRDSLRISLLSGAIVVSVTIGTVFHQIFGTAHSIHTKILLLLNNLHDFSLSVRWRFWNDHYLHRFRFCIGCYFEAHGFLSLVAAAVIFEDVIVFVVVSCR